MAKATITYEDACSITAGLLTFLNSPGKEERYKELGLTVLRSKFVVAYGQLKVTKSGENEQVANVEGPACSPNTVGANSFSPLDLSFKSLSSCLHASGGKAFLHSIAEGARTDQALHIE